MKTRTVRMKTKTARHEDKDMCLWYASSKSKIAEYQVPTPPDSEAKTPKGRYNVLKSWSFLTWWGRPYSLSHSRASIYLPVTFWLGVYPGSHLCTFLHLYLGLSSSSA